MRCMRRLKGGSSRYVLVLPDIWWRSVIYKAMPKTGGGPPQTEGGTSEDWIGGTSIVFPASGELNATDSATLSDPIQ